jgi:hypothetical protein
LEFGVVHGHVTNQLIILIIQVKYTLILSIPADIRLSQRGKIVIPTLLSFGHDPSPVSGVLKDIQTLVVFQDGRVQVVRIAFWILGEDQAKVEH